MVSDDEQYSRAETEDAQHGGHCSILSGFVGQAFQFKLYLKKELH